MNKLFSILILILSAAMTGFAQDTIVLNNGDVLTGKILKQSPVHVFFKSAAFGSISISPRDISEIRISDEQLGEITVPEEAIAKKEGTTGNLPQVEPKKPSAPKKPKKKSQWTGQAGLAIAMRHKTSTTNGRYKEDQYETYRVYGNVDWKGERNSIRWAWTYRYSKDEYQIRDDFLNLSQNYKHSFENKNLYSSAKTVYQQDYNRRIEQEFLQTAEMGIKWFGEESTIKLSTSAGGGYHMYDRLNPARTYSTRVSEPKFIFDEKISWMIIPEKELELTQSYVHLGNLTNYHFLFSAGIQNKLIRNLFLRLEYRLDRDTEVLYDDKGYFDKALLTSLLYKF